MNFDDDAREIVEQYINNERFRECNTSLLAAFEKKDKLNIFKQLKKIMNGLGSILCCIGSDSEINASLNYKDSLNYITNSIIGNRALFDFFVNFDVDSYVEVKENIFDESYNFYKELITELVNTTTLNCLNKLLIGNYKEPTQSKISPIEQNDVSINTELFSEKYNQNCIRKNQLLNRKKELNDKLEGDLRNLRTEFIQKLNAIKATDEGSSINEVKSKKDRIQRVYDNRKKDLDRWREDKLSIVKNSIEISDRLPGEQYNKDELQSLMIHKHNELLGILKNYKKNLISYFSKSTNVMTSQYDNNKEKKELIEKVLELKSLKEKGTLYRDGHKNSYGLTESDKEYVENKYNSELQTLNDWFTSENKKIDDEIQNINENNKQELGRKLKSELESRCNNLKECFEKEENKIQDEIDSIERENESIRNEFDDIVNRNEHIDRNIKLDCPSVTQLPSKIIIGYFLNNYKLGEKSANIESPLILDVESKGNIVIHTSAINSSDNELSEFISKICLRILDSFPIGAVRFHFIDALDNPVFVKFITGFQSWNTNEITRLIVEKKDNYTSVSNKLKNKCHEMVSNKLFGDIRNIYNLYEENNTEYFDYVVIYSGFSSILRSGNKEELNLISSAIKDDSIQHRCGIRYIIIDDSPVCNNRIDDEVKIVLNEMDKNFDLVLKYEKKEISLLNKKIYSLCCDSEYEFESFVEEKCKLFGTELIKKTKKSIKYEDIGFDDLLEIDPYDPVLRIPVGMSGLNIVHIPFSCEDKDGSYDGQNIGLMVLGQSGSGKSSLFHSVILNGCKKYSPDDLQFWLLDFKNNAAAGIYSNTDKNIPHIKLIAPNSKISDAYYILQLLIGEMDSRINDFNKLGKELNLKLSNLIDYNKCVDENKSCKFRHHPRIVLMIDEAQEMFRDNQDGNDLPKDIGNFINILVSKGRAEGIHLAMFAQNLDSQKTYILKDNFINQLKYKVCFRLSSSSVGNSGFKGEFDSRKDEISCLGTGEIYLSNSNSDVKKCQVGFASDKKLPEYFERIISKYSDYKSEVLKIGLTDQLRFDNKVVNSNDCYLSQVLKVRDDKKKISCVLGENSFNLSPVRFVFSQSSISSAFLVGNSRIIESSLLTTLFLALRSYELLICNGVPREENVYNELLKSSNTKQFTLNKIDECVRDAYLSYLNRKEKYENSNAYKADPLFIFMNDFDSQDKIVNNDMLEVSEINSEPSANTFDNFDNLFSMISCGEKREQPEKNKKINLSIRIRDAISKLLEDGYKYNIFLILTLKETSYREFEKSLTSSNNVLLFNDMNYPSFSNSYLIKNFMKDIKHESEFKSITAYQEDAEDEIEIDNESFAIIYKKNENIKFRPVIYPFKETERIKEMIREEK